MRNRKHTLFAICSSLLLSLGASAAPPAHHHGARAAATDVASAKDGPLSFTRQGKGPAVVFIHGLGGDRATWADELVRLSPNYTVVVLDLPGHGMSPPPTINPPAAASADKAAPPPGVDLQKVAQQVAKLIRDQHLAPAVVVGHSLGGNVAAWLPLVDREAVRGVLLVDSTLSPSTMSDAERTKLRADLKRDLIGTLRRLYAPFIKNTAQLDKIVASAQRVPASVFMGYLDYAANNDLDEKVRDVQVPMQLLAGPAVIPDNSDASKARLALQNAGYLNISGFTYEYFPESKHFLFQDEPEHFNAALDKFLVALTRPAVSSAKGRSHL